MKSPLIKNRCDWGEFHNSRVEIRIAESHSGDVETITAFDAALINAFLSVCPTRLTGNPGNTRQRDYHKLFNLKRSVKISWINELTFEAQELSAFSWPIVYRITTATGYYAAEP
ncbi:MAG: hypothetical protein ACREBD_21415, partial [Blastocatellia bacterium]